MKDTVCLIVLNEFTNDSRVLKESQSLQRSGYRVQVLALHGRKLPVRETISGVSVLRMRLLTRNWSRRKSVQAIKYIEFLIRAVCFCRKFDILHCNDLDALPIGVISKFLTLCKQKVVYDAHEFEIHRNGSKNNRTAIRFKSCFEGLLLRYADAVITVSQHIAKAYRRIYAIDSPALVLNCPAYYETAIHHDKFREELGIRMDQKIFLCQGGLLPGRGIEILLDAFSDLSGDDAVIVFLGYGPLESLVDAVSQRCRNVFLRNAVTPIELPDYTASADFGVSFIQKTCMSYTWSLPNKFFEYLMAGLPILSSDLVEQRRIVEQFGVGICVPDGKPAVLKNGIRQIMDMDWDIVRERMDRARRIYCWENQEHSLLNVYVNL